jgi:hypothetical protein
MPSDGGCSDGDFSQEWTTVAFSYAYSLVLLIQSVSLSHTFDIFGELFL